MEDAQWVQYEQWVADFSAMRDAQTPQHAKAIRERTEKTKRNLRMVRSRASLPPTVTATRFDIEAHDHSTDAMQYLMEYRSVDKSAVMKLVREGGAAKTERATRQK